MEGFKPFKPNLPFPQWGLGRTCLWLSWIEWVQIYSILYGVCTIMKMFHTSNMVYFRPPFHNFCFNFFHEKFGMEHHCQGQASIAVAGSNVMTAIDGKI